MSTNDLRWIDDIDDEEDPTYNVFKYYHPSYSGGNNAYKQVTTNNQEYLKISYFPRDHSAISTSDSEVYISKWAWGPLVEHAPAQCPFYSGATIKFYTLNAKATGGSSPLCYNVQRTFNTNITILPGATYNWSRGLYLTYVSGSGTNQYTVKGTSENASSYVRLTMTAPSGLISPLYTKNIWVNKPQWHGLEVRDYITKETNPDLCYWEDNYLEVYSTYSSGQQIDEYGWNLISGGNLYAPPPSPYDLAIITPFSSYVYFQYKAHNTCGWTSYRNNQLWAPQCGRFYSYTPNPVSNELTIEVETALNEEVKDIDSDFTTEFEAVLYNADQKRVKAGKSKGNKIKFNVSDLKKGSYFLHIIDENQVKKEQIMIE